MSDLKRTKLFDVHVAAGATMVDFGGWEMPVQYPEGIVAEHLYTRHCCGIFDVSHMGRILVEGKDRVAFLQHVVSSNVAALEKNRSQYCIIQAPDGSAVDDAYLYCFEEENLWLVINAANIDKDLEYLTPLLKGYDCRLTNISEEWACIAVQGPKSKDILTVLSGGEPLTIEPIKNRLNIVSLEGHTARIARTGYTGEPLGFEVFVKSEDVVWLWNRLVELGAKPAGLGARDTLRMEAGLPLYGHEMGVGPDGKNMPIFAVPLARFAVSFSQQKGDFVAKDILWKQRQAFVKIMNRDFSGCADLPYRIMPITLLDRGVIRAGMEIYKGDKLIGWTTSGTMIPYYVAEGEGLESVITEEVAKRSIGMCYIASDTLVDDVVEVDVRGKRLKAAIPEAHLSLEAPPFARPLIYGTELKKREAEKGDGLAKALALIARAEKNHIWRQQECLNLIPSENTPSRAVQLLSGSDPNFRYAEHRKTKAFYDKDIFYYQGTKFIDETEQLLVEEMKKYFGCTEVETRVTSGQMANTAVFSSLMDFKNRLDRKNDPKRLGYVMNNHIIRGGHLSAQPMGALHDYIAVDPKTEMNAIINFPVLKDNIYKIDVEETKKLIDQYKPEFIIFGKSMVLHKEPVAAIRKFVDEQGVNTTIMYDMAHVLGIVGPSFQDPFAEGAEIVTGSTHKTFFGPQRGVIAVNYKEDELKYELWKTIERRVFPGSVSNHHLGTQLGMLMAAYEMNAFRKEYQAAVVNGAKMLAKALAEEGLAVEGDPSIGYTETHQVVVAVGYGQGAEVAERLEQNNIIVNYQATPDEEGFTASGALRMGVSEMVRFGFGEAEFKQTANLIARCIKGEAVKEEVAVFRKNYQTMHYCFDDKTVEAALDHLAGVMGR
ncbi:MAG: glycine cleavage system aminomethyltransferase GcvT [Lachnospiraceae bacterium]|nr:glycine cleavage system aminomethyltransferase GcvT [Lachnospiraceae bacterium]